MTFRYYHLILIFFIFFNLNTHALETNFASWTGIFINGKATENLGFYLETQSRLARPNPVSNGNRLLLRPAIRYLPWGDSRLQFHLGYGWTPNFSPSRNENRIWQQVLRQEDHDQWWWALRLRTEQRWIQFTNQTAHRLRLFARLHHYFSDDKKFGLSLWNEIFFNLNDVHSGPKAGLDQNRFFIGPHFVLSPKARVEVGYMNLYTSRCRALDDLDSHVYTLYVYLDF